MTAFPSLPIISESKRTKQYFFNLKPIILLEESLGGLHTQFFLLPLPTLLFFFSWGGGIPIIDHMEMRLDIAVIFSNIRMTFMAMKRQQQENKCKRRELKLSKDRSWGGDAVG